MAEVLIARFEEVWGDVVELCADFTPAQWSLPTDCPGWNVRDHISHMIGTERMLLGEQPSAVAEGAPHVKNDIGKANEAWIATYRDWEGPKLLDEFRAVTTRRIDALRALDTEDWDREGFTPEGRGPYRVFMEIRVFDCWYHDQDIREAVDRPGYLEGPVADLSIGRIPGKGMGYVVGKRAAAPPNTTVTFDIAGDPPEGRAVLLETSPRDPTVRIVTDRRTFTRLAGGRWTGDEARTRGRVQVEGDPELGARVVDNMAFTI